MVSEVKTAILTYMDSYYEENLINDFLHTLRNTACYKGHVVVLDYGMSSKAVEKARKEYNVVLCKCIKDRPVFTVRNRDLANAIEGLPAGITHVMVIDGGDVWFQAPISQAFQLCCSKAGYVESLYINDRKWHSYILSTICTLKPEIVDRILRNIMGTKIKNSGMVCGPRNLIHHIVSDVYQLTRESHADFFGIDQICFNYVINSMEEDKKIALPQRFNYVVINHKKGYINDGNKIYDESRELVNVVHNAGGLHRVIKKAEDYKVDKSQYRRVRYI